MHLADGDLVERWKTIPLWQLHVDELGVHALDIGEHQQLLDGGVLAHVALQLGIGVAPLFGGQTKQGDIEQVGFAGVGDGSLCRWSTAAGIRCVLNGVGVDAVVEFGQGCGSRFQASDRRTVLVVLEALELLDEVELELDRDPGGELEGNVLVGIGAAVTSSLGDEAHGSGFLDPLLWREDEAVQAGLHSNPVEFDGIKIRIVELFPDAEKLDGIAIAQPIADHIYRGGRGSCRTWRYRYRQIVVLLDV